MADDTTASIHRLPQPLKRPKTAAERAATYRARKKQALMLPAVIEPERITAHVTERVTGNLSEVRIDRPERDRRTLSISTITLATSALALAGTGITVNAWYARSLGATDVAGWLFLAIGVGADCAALALPSVAARCWETSQPAKALAGWVVWFMTFVFAVTAGIGFASVNIADVTSSRASRVTPAVTQAKTALDDAMAARDRECRGGVGKWCREREAAVASLREAATVSFATVANLADPQADAAIGLAAWLSGGILKPTEHDFAMLRLILLALLPQIGGILLMLGRSPNQLAAIPR